MDNPIALTELWPQGYKGFFMLDLTAVEISTPHKTLNA